MGKFTGFHQGDGINSEMYSMSETKAVDLLKQNPEEFTNHNKYRITRIYPRGSRVESSNFNPLVCFVLCITFC